MKKTTTKSRDVSVPLQTPEGSEWPTRAKVAELLGCSPATVRRMEGTILHPTDDADGVHRFDPVEVLSVLRDRSAKAVDPSKEGERDARVFDMLDAGKGIRDVVTTLRLPVAAVANLFDQWQHAGRRDLVVPAVVKAEIDRCIGPTRDAADLTQKVQSIEAERERLASDNERMTNRFAQLLDLLGRVAATSADLEQALPEFKNELDAEQIEILDRSFMYHQEKQVG